MMKGEISLRHHTLTLTIQFDFILGKSRGCFVYGFFTPEELSIAGALVIGVLIYIILFAVGSLFLFLNREVSSASPAPA